MSTAEVAFVHEGGVVELIDGSCWYTNGRPICGDQTRRLTQLSDRDLENLERKKQAARVAELMRHLIYGNRLFRLTPERLVGLERTLANACAEVLQRSYSTLPAAHKQATLSRSLATLERKLESAEKAAVSDMEQPLEGE